MVTNGWGVRGRNFEHFKKLLRDAQGMGWLATVSHVRMQTSGNSLNTMAFRLMPVTVGYTTCSMKGGIGNL